MAVGQVVKAHAKRASFDSSQFSDHSLRAGFVTSAAEEGAAASRGQAEVRVDRVRDELAE